METIKYNEIIWNTIKVLNLKKCSEIAQKLLLKLKNVNFMIMYGCFEV